MKVDPITSIITEKVEGFYHEEEISPAKSKILKYLMNEHRVNWKLFYFKKGIYERRRTIGAFSTAILLTVCYHIANVISGEKLMYWVTTNVYAHSFTMFLTLAAFISIFFPFTIKKQLDENNIQNIANQAIKENKKREADDEAARKMSEL